MTNPKKVIIFYQFQSKGTFTDLQQRLKIPKELTIKDLNLLLSNNIDSQKGMSGGPVFLGHLDFDQFYLGQRFLDDPCRT